MTQYISNNTPHNDDIVVWEDGTTCYYDELHDDYGMISYNQGDYEIVPREQMPHPVAISLKKAPINWCNSDRR